MHIDPENIIVKLCAEGMNLEVQGLSDEALLIFTQAWNAASNDLEKFIAAHYLARQQKSVEDKLHWDEKALNFAQKINDENVWGAYPSLYLNIGKCHEDLKNFEEAQKQYTTGYSFCHALKEDGYGNMIQSALLNGLERMKNKVHK